MKSHDIHLRAIPQEMFKISILDMHLKIINLRLQLHSHGANELTHLPLHSLVLHISGVSELGSIGSGNGLLPVRCQTFTCNNADLLSIGPLGANFNAIRIKIQSFSFKCTWECHLRNGGHFVLGKMSRDELVPVKGEPFDVVAEDHAWRHEQLSEV